jgi:NIPSNAP protein
MIDDIVIADLKAGAAEAALGRLERWLKGSSAADALYACWYSTIGPANRIFLWRGFSNEESLDRERTTLAMSADPYGLGDVLTNVSANTFRRIAFHSDFTTDIRGPLFEVRDYLLRPDTLSHLFDLWRPNLPARLALAPWVTAMYALTGPAPRVLHIYPWQSLEQRNAVRDGAQKVGWPPRDAPAQIATQLATIYLPAGFSPLH